MIGGLTAERPVRRWLIPAASLIFFAGLLVSAIPYYSGKPLDYRRAVISDLASPGDNPRGYLAGAAGIAGCGLLLVPAAIWFYRVLRRRHRGLARCGAILLGTGLAGAMAIGAMAPFESAYSDIHIYVAYVTFILMSAGIFAMLLAAVRDSESKFLRGAAVFQGCVLAFLLYLLYGLFVDTGPGFLDDSSFFRSVAFCEWLLCGGNVAYLYILGAAVARADTQRSLQE